MIFKSLIWRFVYVTRYSEVKYSDFLRQDAERKDTHFIRKKIFMI